MNLLHRTILAVACCGIVSFAEDSLRTSVDELPYRPVDIDRVKAAHYRRQGFELLPEYIADSTIGPGQFAVIGNTTVRKGATLTVRPGTTIMFEPQNRLIIEGDLFAVSNDNGSVLFSHMPHKMRYIKIDVADSLWNGIMVESGGGLFLNRIAIANATAGITITGPSDRIDLSCVDISGEVATPLSIDGKTISLSDPRCVNSSDLVTVRQPADPLPAPPAGTHVKKVIRIGSCILAAAGLGTAGYGAWRYRKYGLKYKESTDPSRYTADQIDDYRQKALEGGVAAFAGGIVGILGITGFTLTFVF